MAEAYMLAIDLAKRSFQVCATDRAGSVLYNRTVSRAKLEQLLESQAPCIVAMEACATSHFWGRFARALGHEARLIPPIYVKPFVKRQKNDATDAAAIAEAAVRPNMHYVAVKSPEHQARAVAYRTHQCFVGQRTQMINALRSHLAEFGHVFAQGAAHVKDIRIAIDNEALELPDGVREVAQLYLEQIDTLSEKIDLLSFKLREATQVNAEMRRLCTVPGVGPVTAGAIMAFAPDLRSFASGRNFAAWLGLVPRQRSWWQSSARRYEQDGAKRHPQTFDRRSDEQDKMDRAQRRAAGQLAGQVACPQAENGGCCRIGQQDGAHCLGYDDT
jgi:transposase